MSFSFIVVAGLICGAITAAIGRSKNFGVVGSFFTGALLGIVGVVIIICMKPDLPKAPDGMRAVKCPKCNAVQNVPPKGSAECWHSRNQGPSRSVVHNRLSHLRDTATTRQWRLLSDVTAETLVTVVP